MALTDRLLYEFLLGDIAAQRGRPELAAQAYLDLAKTTRDPRVARRAAQLTFEAHQYDQSVEALRLWQELEPESPLARQMLVSILLAGGKLQEARAPAAALLAADPAHAGRTFLNLYSLLSPVPDKAAALDWLIEVAHPWPQVAEAHWALAQAAFAANKQALALDEAQQAAALKPEWDMALMLHAQLLARRDAEAADALLGKFLEAHPDEQEVRLFRARQLLEQKQYARARSEFERLLQQRPGRADLAFAIAMISLQLGERERAERELRQALAGNGPGKDDDTLHYYLAQLAEARQDEATALAEYRQIKAGQHAFDAALRMAYLLNKAGRLAEARQVLQRTTARDQPQRVRLLMVEAQLLREAKQNAESYRVLEQGLKRFPDEPELLYQTALMADRLDKTDVSERLLRRLIEVEPKNPHAYNALGYGWLARNVRIKEAMVLVEQAWRMAPDDAAILDSMGWGYFRLGQLDKSLDFLRRAFAANPDPEIAAHLGEVLWVSGDRAAGQQVLQDSLKAHPDDATLREVMRRLGVQ